MKYRFKKFCSVFLALASGLALIFCAGAEYNQDSAARNMQADMPLSILDDHAEEYTAEYTNLITAKRSIPVLAGRSDIVSARQYIQFKCFQRLPAVLASSAAPLACAYLGAAILKYRSFSPSASQFFSMLTAQRGKDGKK